MTGTVDQNLNKTSFTLVKAGPTTEPITIQAMNRDVIFKVDSATPPDADPGHLLEQGNLITVSLLAGEDLFAKGGQIVKTGG